MIRKFNSGRGALLCECCRKIIAADGPQKDGSWATWFANSYVFEVEGDRYFCNRTCQFQFHRHEKKK